MKYFDFATKIGLIGIFYVDGKITEITIDRIFDYKTQSDKKILDCVSQIKEYLNGNRKFFECDYLIRGTPFQMSVWKNLTKIPYGETRTYKEIAENIGKPKAVRAVANAIGRNPLPILIPCHRVIGSDGKLHGYRYGIEIKRKLLAIEKNYYSR